MSREIKFRVWDKDLGEYFRGRKITDLRADLAPEDDSKDDCVGIIIQQLCPARYEFEQYTGVKDEDGVEIYEGDILAAENGDLLRVIWDYDRCGLVGAWVSPDYWRVDDKLGVETQYIYQVVGNIHENPELLEGMTI